jgi:hypothetical protein
MHIEHNLLPPFLSTPVSSFLASWVQRNKVNILYVHRDKCAWNARFQLILAGSIS